MFSSGIVHGVTCPRSACGPGTLQDWSSIRRGEPSSNLPPRTGCGATVTLPPQAASHPTSGTRREAAHWERAYKSHTGVKDQVLVPRDALEKRTCPSLSGRVHPGFLGPTCVWVGAPRRAAGATGGEVAGSGVQNRPGAAGTSPWWASSSFLEPAWLP